MDITGWFIVKITINTVNIMTHTASNLETKIATRGCGCFWCLEAVYQLVKGVLHVESGYAGGDTLTLTMNLFVQVKQVMLRLCRSLMTQLKLVMKNC